MVVDSYTISYDNLDCTSDIYDNITGIDGDVTMYTLTDLEEGTEYSVTVTTTLTAGITVHDTSKTNTMATG